MMRSQGHKLYRILLLLKIFGNVQLLISVVEIEIFKILQVEKNLKTNDKLLLFAAY